MKQTVPKPGGRAASAYLKALCWGLFAYALLGKGFAYLGLPPLFPGEALLAAGFALAFRSGTMPATLASPVNLVLVALMTWTVARMAPYVGTYGVDTLRDGAVAYYGGFALVVEALVLADPTRVDLLIQRYGQFAKWFPLLGPVAYALTRFSVPLPVLNSSGVPIVEVRPGEAAVHVAGVAAFATVGLARIGPVRWGALLCLALMVASANRGAMLAISVSLAIAVASTLQIRQAALAALAGACLLGSALAIEAYAAEWRPAEGSDERRVSATQLVENFSGILGSSQDSGEGTKQWREDWWRRIVDETVHGPLFWTGRGFGVNLAEVADLPGWNPEDLPPLRSPHSVHMTMLARGGVPLLTLWLGFLVAWLATVAGSAARARRLGHPQWHAVFVSVACYVVAILIDASFDVALEGPMVGVWFWCLIGFGLGASAVYAGVANAAFRARCA